MTTSNDEIKKFEEEIVNKLEEGTKAKIDQPEKKKGIQLSNWTLVAASVAITIMLILNVYFILETARIKEQKYEACLDTCQIGINDEGKCYWEQPDEVLDIEIKT